MFWGMLRGSLGVLWELLEPLLEPLGPIFGDFLRSGEGPGTERGDMLDLQYLTAYFDDS